MKQGIIRTASPLSDAELTALKQRFAAQFGEGVEFRFELDPSLIGGFTVQVDGKLYDMSMKAKLQALVMEQSQQAQRDADVPVYMTEEDKQRIAENLEEHFKKRLSEMDSGARIYDYGTVESCADGIVHIDGLSRSLYGELLEFENGAYGMALELSSKGVSAVLFSGLDTVSSGSMARGTGMVLSVPVGDAMLGRVVDPLGRPLDGEPLEVKGSRPIECPAPSIMDRAPVNQPLMTGILSIDSMIPIGKGQRELIIGDRQMGKSVIALSAMLNQSKQNVISVYCAIGQKASTVAQFVETLKKRGAMQSCIVVASTAADSAAMQYITPYAACSIAEHFMLQGRDVLIVYDDLSKHAASYRTMSLLLKRPPGREAYPGDVFYLHSRLLERAAKLSDAKGSGSLTALPIVETMAGDISAYIPTNVISITDGQIYLESELFHSGVRPAVNVGLSVSRVGRSAQPPAMRKVSGQLRLKLAQYRELAVFAQFDSDLDPSTQKLLMSGERLTELLKQDQNTVYPLSEQVAVLVAYAEGLFDQTPVEQTQEAKIALLESLRISAKGPLGAVDTTQDLSDDTRAALVASMKRFFDDRAKRPEARNA